MGQRDPGQGRSPCTLFILQQASHPLGTLQTSQHFPGTKAASSTALGSALIPAQTSSSTGGMGWLEGPED